MLRSKLFAKRANRRNAHDPIGRMFAPTLVMLILELKKFEVFRFKEETVERDDAEPQDLKKQSTLAEQRSPN